MGESYVTLLSMARTYTPSIYSGHASKRPQEPTMLGLWLKSHGISKNQFARMCGCTGKMVDMWCSGQVIPSLIFAFVIEKCTEGGVGAEAWLGTQYGKHMWNEMQKRLLPK